jgi:3-phenylpropionate/cinnamic acid dioxygenase small subunit
MIDAELTQEIDKAHTAANEALKNKKLDTYIQFFDDGLQYEQLNGKIIGKAKLTDDIKLYFNRIKSYSGSFHRKEINTTGDRVIEVLTQHAKITIKVFIFFSKNWTVEREGIYEWIKVNGNWKICKVKILAEKVF